ncbi:MAG: DoxX family membrane protein [Actinobacteria bacterium]|uniref:Unannotated protein n=1 Tax=freshwater metagenome TaxID=449393 RepID=A0A6J6GX65_9ZZZZ|nr:DoxX family membrane protein [Actinomycetota bacterium]
MKYVRLAFKLLLGLALIYAGIGHLTFSRIAFQAQVPPWLPMDADLVVVLSGFVEIALGLGLIILKKSERRVGIVVSLFFLAVFPGNISQFLTHTDAFGLNSDSARAVRLVFQPVLVLWALWSTGFFKPRKS